MTFYCRLHPDFEGLDIGKLHDHMEKEHIDILKTEKYREEIEKFFNANIAVSDARLTDRRIIVRTWGRPPKLGTEVADNERAK